MFLFGGPWSLGGLLVVVLVMDFLVVVVMMVVVVLFHCLGLYADIILGSGSRAGWSPHQDQADVEDALCKGFFHYRLGYAPLPIFRTNTLP